MRKSNAFLSAPLLIIFFTLCVSCVTYADENLSSDDMMMVGYEFEMGENGREQDYAQAHDWYEKSALLGNGIAQYNLALMYLQGKGIEVDYLKASEWFQQSAEQGDADAQYKMAQLYESGLGVEKDLFLAKEWYEKSAEQGGINAQYFLAQMYLEGNGTEQNTEMAIKWLTAAAEQDDIDSMEELHTLYLFGDYSDADQYEKWNKRLNKLKKQDEPEIVLIPKGFTGEITVVFGVAEGEAAVYEGDARVYKISPEGLLVTQMNDNGGITSDEPEFYYVNKKQERTPIVNRWHENELRDKPTLLLSNAVGIRASNVSGFSAYRNNSCSFKHSEYYVGSPKNYVKDGMKAQTDPFHVYLEDNVLACPEGDSIGGKEWVQENLR